MNKYDQFGPYKIIRHLGEGTFGPVLEGCDDDEQRAVIKLCTLEDQDLRHRFQKAAEEARQLVHPNIVTTLAVGNEKGEPWLAQEFLPGQALSAVIRRRSPLQPAARMDLLLHVARGLEAAHNQNFGHYDLTPENVRLETGGGVKVSDFGIARLASSETGQTQKGITLGSAVYLPPEQVRGGELDLRVDIFSYGALAFETLTYERPFHGQTLSALLYQVLYKPPESLTSVWPSCPLPLVQLVERCLEKDREDRFASFSELIASLSRLRREVAEGRWPGLDEVPEAPPVDVHADELMTHSAFTRTAQDVVSDVAIPSPPTPSPPATPPPPTPSPPPPSAAAEAGEEATVLRAPLETVRMTVPIEPDSEGEVDVARTIGSQTERLSDAPELLPTEEEEEATVLRAPMETVRLTAPPEEAAESEDRPAAAVGAQTERLSDAPEISVTAGGDATEDATIPRVSTETVRLTVPPVLDEEATPPVAVGSQTESLPDGPEVFSEVEEATAGKPEDSSEEATVLKAPVETVPKAPVETVRLTPPPVFDEEEVSPPAVVGSQTERLSEAVEIPPGMDRVSSGDEMEASEEETLLRTPTETVRLPISPEFGVGKALEQGNHPPESVGTDRLPMPPELLEPSTAGDLDPQVATGTMRLPVPPVEAAGEASQAAEKSSPPTPPSGSSTDSTPSETSTLDGPPAEAPPAAVQQGQGPGLQESLPTPTPDSLTAAFQPADSGALTVRMPVTGPAAPTAELQASAPSAASEPPSPASVPTAFHPVAPPPTAPLPTAPPPTAPSPPQAPSAEPASFASGPPAPTVELASSAEEIGQLVAAGKLEDALQQLESVRRQQTPEGLQQATPPSSTPAQKPAAPIFEPPAPEQPTPGPPPQGIATPPEATAMPLMGRPAEAGLPEVNLQPRQPPARRQEAKSGGGGGKKWLLGLALVVPLLLAVGWGVLSSRRAPEVVEPAIPAPPASTVEPEIGGGTVDTGLLVLRAAPWGRVTEITDGDGYSVSLPEEVHTPLALYLPPGLYRVTLEYSEEGVTPAIQTCEAEVELSIPAECNVILAEPDVTAYFKENGWWR